MFIKDLVMYRPSNLVHKPVVVTSLRMLNKTSLTRHNWIILMDLTSKSSHSSSIIVTKFLLLPLNTICNPYCNIVWVFNFLRSKLLFHSILQLHILHFLDSLHRLFPQENFNHIFNPFFVNKKNCLENLVFQKANVFQIVLKPY